MLDSVSTICSDTFYRIKEMSCEAETRLIVLLYTDIRAIVQIRIKTGACLFNHCYLFLM